MFSLQPPRLAPSIVSSYAFKKEYRKIKKEERCVYMTFYAHVQMRQILYESACMLGSFAEREEECCYDSWDMDARIIDKRVREQKREYQRPRRKLRSKVRKAMFAEIQSGDESRVAQFLGDSGLYYTKLLEDCLIFGRLLLRSETKTDYAVAWTTFYKFRFPQKAAMVSMAESLEYITRILTEDDVWQKHVRKTERVVRKGFKKTTDFFHSSPEINVDADEILDGYDSGDSEGPMYWTTDHNGNEVPYVEDPPLVNTAAIDLMKRIKAGEFNRVQSADEHFRKLRSLLDNYTALKKSPIITKLYRCLMYALSLSLFDKVGINFEKLRYSKLEEEAIKSKYHLGCDMIHTLLDTTLFVCERGYQCMKTGSLDPIYHSGGKYEEWFHEARQIMLLRKTYGTPGFEGDYHTFLKRVLDSIEKGDAMYKFATRHDGSEKNLIDKVLSELKLVKAFLVTQREACKSRSSPFSILVHGTSSVGKSMFVDMLFNVYADLFGLPKGAENVYTRNPANKYWDLFKSCMWGCKMDDIAFLRPVSGPPDPSLLEVISVINNVVSVPPQADLSDKGQTPILFKFVVGSTNTEHINAHNSFSCPLAIQRRFPFVVTIEPRAEYRSSDGFLDSHNLPASDGKRFPDFWDIKVKKVVMCPGNENQAELRLVSTFDNVSEFLQWFGKKAKQHEETQAKAKACNVAMDNITICKTCFAPSYDCSCNVVQAGDFYDDYFSDFDSYLHAHYSQAQMVANREPDLLVRWETQYGTMSWWECFYFCVIVCLHWLTFKAWWPIRWGCRFLRFHKIMYWMIFRTSISHKLWARAFHAMGTIAHQKIGKYKFLIYIVGALSFLLVGYGTYKLATGRGKPRQTFIEGLTHSVPLPSGHEYKNVWHSNKYQVSDFDLPDKSIGYKSLGHRDFLRMVMRNCISISSEIDTGVRRIGKAFCLGGNLYITNSHNIPLDHFKMEIRQSHFNDGVTTNIEIQVTSQMILRRTSSDIAFLYLPQLPPKKDLTPLVTVGTFQALFPCTLLTRKHDGTKFFRPMIPLGYEETWTEQTQTLDVEVMCRVGSDCLTELGDCGSILVSHTSSGPVILGFHFKGNDLGYAYSIVFTQEMVSEATEHFGVPIISGSSPDLTSELQSYTITKSLPDTDPSRFIEKGTAEIYGTLNVPSRRMSSKVMPTAIRQELLKEGYEVKYGKPVMAGWAPKRNALIDMVNVPAKIEYDILKECSKAYLSDILDGIGDDINLIHPYDQHVAINGAPGVAYVDPINKATSSGFPWRKSKKHLMCPRPCNLHEFCYEVNNDVQNKIDSNLQRYRNGEACHPIYTGSFKDEPRSHKKIEASNTRLFCADNLPNTIIVRQFFLSIVRVIQRNKFLFEASVGLACQSSEWKKLYSHLTKFGKDRMVAGDFKAYDKKLEPALIKEAFWVMIQLAAKAGYSLEQQKVMWGIAHDTSTCFVEFFGTLYRLYGTNPSGNSLTVIVNCVANSLYMRYAYYKLNPKKECVSFKKNVVLATYGDDNIMGVSKDVPWFNHTSLASELAKIGVTYTMAEKDRDSVPYISIDECSFLKRTFRFDAELDTIVAPLDHDSIEKMLTTTVESKTLGIEAQTIEIVGSAIREYFWYGRVVFEEKLALLRSVVERSGIKDYIQDHTFPTYEELEIGFRTLSRELEKADRC
jgi:hypothetical protein